MDIIGIIEKKKLGQELTKEEIQYWIDGVVSTYMSPDIERERIDQYRYYPDSDSQKHLFCTLKFTDILSVD